MENRVHPASNSSSSSSTIIATTTSVRMARRTKMWIIFVIIVGILTITAIIVPITIIVTREANETATMTATTRITTTQITTTRITTTQITTKAPIKSTTTSDILRPSTTKSEDSSNSAENITNIYRLKYINPGTNEARYWYQLEGEAPSTGWMMEYMIFRAYTIQMPGTEPVYRYHTQIDHIWHNTLQMDQISSVPESDQWVSDSIAFYCYRTLMASEKLQPIRRYWSEYRTSTHSDVPLRMYLLTAETEEKEQPEWTFDKVIFYALPPE